MTAALRSLTVSTLIFGIGESIGAQSPMRAVADAPRSRASFVTSRPTGASASGEPGDSTRASTVVAATGGSEIVVVRVPIPDAIVSGDLASSRMQYRVSDGAVARVVGRNSGVVPSGAASPLLITMKVSKRAPAGRSVAATVEFTSGSSVVVLPIEIDVPKLRDVSVVVLDARLSANRGGSSLVRFRVTNIGNTRELLSLKMKLPSGWRAEVEWAAGTAVAEPGRAVDGTIRVRVPDQARPGVNPLELLFYSSGSALAVERVQLDVVDRKHSLELGPVLATSVGSAGIPGMSALGVSGTLSGALSDSTRVEGYFSYAPLDSSAQAPLYGLSRMGLATTVPSIGILGSRMSLSMGATSTEASELGGSMIAGVGARSTLSRDIWSVSSFAMRPYSTRQQVQPFAFGEGEMLGGELARATPRAQTALFASHLADRRMSRDLDAIGMRTQIGSQGANMMSGELAWRSSGDQAGVGVSTTVRRTTASTTVDLRASHAPGGTRGFARATDDALLSASTQMGSSALLSMSSWYQRDEDITVGQMRNSGWQFSPSIALPRQLGTAALEFRGSRFHTGSSRSGLESVELSAGASGNTAIWGMQIGGRSSLGRNDRTLTTTGSERVQISQLRLDHQLTAQRYTAFGNIATAWSQQQVASAGMPVRSYQSLTVRLDNVRPIPTLPISFEGEAQQIRSLGANHTLSIRSAARLDLKGMGAVTIGAERNPFVFLAGPSNKSNTLYSVRFTRETVLPRFRKGTPRVVFHDLNGNGARDRDEPGVGGVVILCGAVELLADREGQFTCAKHFFASVDPRSVPSGLVSLSRNVASNSGDIPLASVGTLTVELVLAEQDTVAIAATELAKAIISARDDAGATWLARSVGMGVFTFDALPSGNYTVVFDAGDIGEPVRLQGTAPKVLVTAKTASQHIRMGLRTRTMKMKEFFPAAPALQPTPTGTSPRSEAGSRAKPRVESTADQGRSK